MSVTDSWDFTFRSLPTIGSARHPRSKCLSVAVNERIYYFGGDIAYDEVTDDVSCGTIFIFDTTSNTWTEINTNPPADKCSNTLRGVAVGTNIWVLEGKRWHTFDTIQLRWHDTSVQLTESTIDEHCSFVVQDDKVIYYDNAPDSDDMNVVVLETQTKKLQPHPQGYGTLPYERRSPIMVALDHETLFMYASFSYEAERARKHGEMFYYDVKDCKWARADGSKKNKRMKDNTCYLGQIGHVLLFRGYDPVLWTLDLSSFAWKSYTVGGLDANAQTRPKAMTLLGDKIYYCMGDGSVHVVDLTIATSERIMTGVIGRAKEKLSAIKPPVEVIDEFSTEPVVIDSKLSEVKLDAVKTYNDIPATFKALFPLIDPEKIVANTVPEPSETVRIHKNYLHYLALAWANHFSVVLSPDIVFFTILCEIADEIMNDPDSYRHLFTDSLEKKKIMALTHNVEHIDLNQIIEGISKNTPVDAGVFTANFSSSTTESQLAMQSAFCELASAYYYYVSGRCGIPRVKVLGCKEDWQAIEHKVHRMRTEVFSQDLTTTKKLSTYLKKIETQVRKIYTTREPSFWKEMFYIDDCSSGHTAVINGWIALFYREHEMTKKDGVAKYSGNDFYNYNAHIATVKWQNVETSRFFELKSGLVSSRIVNGGASELDAKFPWLEPSFSHVIVETDGSNKMSPEQFKTYIETLDWRDRSLMETFYDLLKDKPRELVKGGHKELTFRYELLQLQIDAWIENFTKTGVGMTKLDFAAKNSTCDQALSVYRDFHESNRPAAEALCHKIQQYLALDRYVKSVNLAHIRASLVPLEAGIINSLIGYASLEELTVSGESGEIYEQLAQLLLHPECKLKILRIDGEDFYPRTSAKINLANFSESLLKTTAPLESLFTGKFIDEQLAISISHLCTKPNGLKKYDIGTRISGTAQALVILMRGVVTSKTLEEISLFDVGRKQVIEGNKRTYVSAMDDELAEFIAVNLPQNPSLRVINQIRLEVTSEQLSRILQVPTLRAINRTATTDLSFLKVTKQLERVNFLIARCAPEQAEHLREFLADENCTLTNLDLSQNDFTHSETMGVIMRGLAKNKSLRILNLSNIRIGNTLIEEEVSESLLQWLESEGCPVVQFNSVEGAAGLSFKDSQAQRILAALVKNKTITKFQASLYVSAEEYHVLMDLIATTSTLTHLSTVSKHRGFNVSEQQILDLQAALEAKTSLKCHFGYRFFDKN